MIYQTVFKRYELKYMLTELQKDRILDAISPYMELDRYKRTTIRNVYFDTDDQQNEIMEIFRELANSGKCVILVSHSQDVAQMCDERYELVKISGKKKRG